MVISLMASHCLRSFLTRDLIWFNQIGESWLSSSGEGKRCSIVISVPLYSNVVASKLKVLLTLDKERRSGFGSYTTQMNVSEQADEGIEIR